MNLPLCNSALRRAYQIDNVRGRLLDVADQVLSQDGIQRLSLRAIAAKTGIAPSTVYYHFKDKPALLGDLAARGFAQLAKRMRSAFDQYPSETTRIITKAYIKFATENPSLYRLMYEVLDTYDFERVSMAEQCAFQVMVDSAARDGVGRFACVIAADIGQDPSRDASNTVRDTSMALWATARGIAAMALERRPRDGGPPDDLIAQALRGRRLLWGHDLTGAVARQHAAPAPPAADKDRPTALEGPAARPLAFPLRA